MESTTARKKWITLLLTATMGVALLFGATACNSNGGNNNGIVEGNESPTVAPDVDADADTESESPSASASAQ